VPDQKKQTQIQTPVDVQQAPQQRQVEGISDPIAREEMSDSMGGEWDLRVAKNDGAAPAGVDGQSRNPLSLGLLNALDETIDKEKNEARATRARDLLNQLQLRISKIADLPEEERQGAIDQLQPLLDSCRSLLEQMPDSLGNGAFNTMLESLDLLSVDPLS